MRTHSQKSLTPRRRVSVAGTVGNRWRRSIALVVALVSSSFLTCQSRAEPSGIRSDQVRTLMLTTLRSPTATGVMGLFMTTDLVSGGWEKWLQIQFGYDIATFAHGQYPNKHIQYSREKKYPDGSCLYDFRLDQPDKQPAIIGELKVQNKMYNAAAAAKAFVDDTFQDVKCINQSNRDKYVFVAMGVWQISQEEKDSLNLSPAFLKGKVSSNGTVTLWDIAKAKKIEQMSDVTANTFVLAIYTRW
jgi:hypothetical protein